MDSVEKVVLDVAPFTGAWIEIRNGWYIPAMWPGVAPFTGAWIEITPMGT